MMDLAPFPAGFISRLCDSVCLPAFVAPALPVAECSGHGLTQGRSAALNCPAWHCAGQRCLKFFQYRHVWRGLACAGDSRLDDERAAPEIGAASCCGWLTGAFKKALNPPEDRGN